VIPAELTKSETNPEWDRLSPEEKRKTHERERLQGRVQMVEAGVLALDGQLEAMGVSPELLHKFREYHLEMVREAHRLYDEKVRA